MKNKLFITSILLTSLITNYSFASNIKNNSNNINQEVKNQNYFNSIRLKWIDFLTGSKFINQLSPQEKVDYINSIDSSTENLLNKLILNNDKYIFENYKDMKNGVQVYGAYNNIKTLARAYNIPESKFYKSSEIKDKVNKAMEWMNKNAYYIGAPENGNWWQWELGIPKSINEIVAFMYEDMPQDKKELYLKTSQYFQPFARYSGYSPSAVYSSSPEKRISTGGNRMDTVIISFMRGVLMNDPVQILDATSAVGDVAEFVSNGDGFYKDGSFVQHGNIPYNGTYASVLFDGLGSVLYLTQNTPYEIKDKKINNIYEAIINGYSYLYINGGITDAVSGRSISRNNSSDLTRGVALLGSMALLSEGAPQPYKTQIQEFIKTAITENNSSYNIDSLKNLTIKNILLSIKNNSSIKPNKIYGTKIFSGMDRAIYKTKTDGKFVVSMHSSRIGNYESMNGENIKGWHTGDGMTYIYGIDSNQFTNFWPTVDLYHLPGTTESINNRNDKSGERRHKIKMSPKSWVGGSASNDMALVGMDFLSWNNETLGKKSWFMIDNSIIALGSNISSSDGVVHTTIDNRIINKFNSNKVYLNGKLMENNLNQLPNNLLITLEGNLPSEEFTYKILDADKVIVKKENREGNWKNVGGTSTTSLKENYFTAYIDHGKNPKNSKYSYIIIPMSNENILKNYDWNSIKINQQDENAHYISKKNIKAINYWKDSPYKVDKFKSYSTLSLIAKEENNILELWLADPTQLSQIHSTLEIDGKYSLIETNDKTLKIKDSGNKTILKFNTQNIGQSINIKLKKI